MVEQKTTIAYLKFYDAILSLHKDEKEFFEENILNEIEIRSYDRYMIEMWFSSYIYDVENEQKLEAAKKLANEMLEMLADYKYCEQFEYFEGDDYSSECNIYHPGEEIPSNYFMGCKTKYDFHNLPFRRNR